MAEKPTYEELKERIQELEQVESKRKRNEELLIHSRDLMDYIISHARSAIAVHDRDLNYIYVSKRYLEEYKVKEQNVIGKHHYEVFPDLPQKWRDVHQRSLAGEVLSAEEDPYYREDGSVDWTRWECRPWYESEGSIGGIIIYTEVINERKEMEESLRKSEQQLSTHLLNTPVGALSWDLEFKAVEWNPAAEAIFGYTKEEVIGKHATELILPGNMKELVDSVFQDLLSEKGGTRRTTENITKDGRRIICDWYNTTLKDADGKVTGVASLVHDITERKQAEDTQRRHYKEMAALNDLIHRVSASLSLDQVVKSAIDGIVKATNPDLALLFLREGDRLLLKGHGPSNSKFTHQQIPVHRVGECMCGLAVSQGKPLYSINIHSDPRCTWNECKEAGLKSLATLPLLSDNEIIGALALASGRERIFEDNAAFLETLSSQASIGLQNALLHEELKSHASGLDVQVAERTAELEKRTRDLERFNKLFVDRELRMVELKKRIGTLEKELAAKGKR